MRDHDVGTRGEGPGRAVAANGAAAVGRKRGKRKTRRSWNVEQKIRITRKSLASSETITAVARRYGIMGGMLWSWRKRLRQGKLAAPSSAQAQPAGAFAAVEVKERCSVLIEGRGVRVRLEGIAESGRCSMTCSFQPDRAPRRSTTFWCLRAVSS